MRQAFNFIKKILKLQIRLYKKHVFTISNRNWTEWSTIQGLIRQVISKSDERAALGRLEIKSTIDP